MTTEPDRFIAQTGLSLSDLEDFIPANKTVLRQLLAHLQNLTFFDAFDPSSNLDYRDVRPQITSVQTYDSFDDYSATGESIKSVQTATIVSFAALVIVAILGYLVSRHCCFFGAKPPDLEGNQPRVSQFSFLGYGAPVMRRLSTRIRATNIVVKPENDLPPAYEDLFPPPPLPTISIMVENQAQSHQAQPSSSQSYLDGDSPMKQVEPVFKPETAV